MRRWAVVHATDNDRAPTVVRWCWTEAGAWRWARRRFTSRPWWLHGWPEVRRRGAHATPMTELLDAELERLTSGRWVKGDG